MPISPSIVPKHMDAGMQMWFKDAMHARLKNIAPIMDLMMKVKSDKDQETMPWLKGIPAVRRFIAQRIAREIDESYMTVVNYKWEASVEILQDTLEDCLYGQVKARMMQLADAFVKHIPSLLATRLAAGVAGTIDADDGVDFFSTVHTLNPDDNQSNKITQGLTDDGLTTAVNTMMAYTDDKGELLNIVPDTLIVPIALRKAAKQLVESTALTSATQLTNIHQNGFNVICLPNLSSATEWYLAETKGPIKPIVFQERRAVTSGWVDNIKPGDKSSKVTLTYGADGRYQIWPIFWPSIAVCDATF